MSIRSNISQRTKFIGNTAVDDPDITIQRIGQSDITVPITARSVRRFMLMSEDYIQLEFSLQDAEHFGIGDHIADEIFGLFYITEEQMPRYNQSTGGYDYSLRFDADYMVWKNYIFCLYANNTRMESRWNLTDTLTSHVQQIANNVNNIIGAVASSYTNPDTGTTYYTNNGYGIDITADNAAEIKHLTYEGVNIIEAMGMIATEWGCEWWVTNDEVAIGNVTYDHTIHFGKCEDGARRVLSMGGSTNNVESMDIARDQQTYCNRLYAYGGTQNIPETYDKRLEFTATTNPRITTFYDANRELTLEMIQGEGSIPSTTLSLGNWTDSTSSNPHTYTQQTTSQSLSGRQTFVADLTSEFEMESDDWAATDIPNVSCNVTLHYGSSVLFILANVTQLAGVGHRLWVADINLEKEINLGSSAVSVYLEIQWSASFVAGSSHVGDPVTHSTSGTITATQDASTATKTVVVVFNGNEYNCTFSGSTKNISNKPSGMVNGSKYTIKNLDLLKVPESWYTYDYSTGTLATVGEKRLHLPLASYPNRYIENSGSLQYTQTVEQAVIFNDIFPKLTLRIKSGSMSTTPKKQKIEHSDGSVSYEDWTQYSFKLEYQNNNTWADFNFSISYMLDGAKLQGVFCAPTDANATGHLLAGMTFDLGFNEREFTIIRNEDYGVNLPNETLKPTEGDTLFLTGWNPQAMNELGMVATAEAELASKAEEYLDAINEGQFTITARMISAKMMASPFCTGTGVDANGRRRFGLFEAGQRVRVTHAAFADGYKNSRVIGYELKLDKPWDTPSYTIGETEAYSRLKKIEKELTKL